MARRKVQVKITWFQLIMIIYTDIQNIPAKVWKDYFVAANSHSNHCLYFYEYIKKIAP